MQGYWCQCEQCGSDAEFTAAYNTTSICTFIRDVLVPSRFDQELLLRVCPTCGKRALRITYEFPRRVREGLRVLHIVGHPPNEGDDYLPMMWESYPISDPDERWFHFNYMNGRNPFGLNRAAVFDMVSLRRIFEIYRERTGHPFLTNLPGVL